MAAAPAGPPPATARTDGAGVSSADGTTWDERTGAIRDEVDARLVDWVATAAAELRPMDDDLVPIADELQRWVAGGGKRLRPVLVVLGHELAGGVGDDVVGAAVAVELVHTWALVHDDLIDASDTRRGTPTTHRRFTSHHLDHGWAGNPDDWGDAIAILVGDLIAVLADDSFTTMDPTRVDLRAGVAAFSRLRREVVAGQILDVTVAASRDADIARALHVATLKSGRYSVTRPLEVGARLARADDELLTTLRAAGDALGVAFQLRDDLLGLFGDSEVTGKPVGDDLREGKRTVLMAEAMARLDADDAARLDAMLGVRDLDDVTVGDGLAMVRDSGAEAATVQRIDDLLQVARTELAALPAGTARDSLGALATLIATRRH